MRNEHRNSEEHEVQLGAPTDGRVRGENSPRKGKKKKNSKFRNSKFGKRWFGLPRWKRITAYVILALLILLLLVFTTVYVVYNSGFRNSVNKNDLGISSEIEDKYGKTDIFNVVLFGLDTRDANSFQGRSDSIIIVSVDKKNNIVKLSSILRDSYVAIEGHKNQKITHAYAFGGAQLAIKTINQNFNMNITDYVTFNFAKLGEAIDLVGGVDMEVTEEERLMVNDIGDDENPSFGYLQQSGFVHLTGEQAVTYARIRKIDSDVDRSDRQRKLLEALLVQVRKISPAKYAEFGRTVMGLCETSLSFTQAMSYASMINNDIQIQTIVIPGEKENAIGGIYDGAWVWRYDLQQASETLHLFIYGEVPEPTTTSSGKTQKWNKDKTEQTSAPKSDKGQSTGSSSGSKTPTPASTEPSTTTPVQTPQNTTEPQVSDPPVIDPSAPSDTPEPDEGDTPNGPETDDQDAAA